MREYKISIYSLFLSQYAHTKNVRLSHYPCYVCNRYIYLYTVLICQLLLHFVINSTNE